MFSVRDERFCQAVETAAGGKLYNVVIDTEQVGKELLKGGNLQRRCTFIPLNKISARLMDQNTIRAAKQVLLVKPIQGVRIKCPTFGASKPAACPICCTNLKLRLLR